MVPKLREILVKTSKFSSKYSRSEPNPLIHRQWSTEASAWVKIFMKSPFSVEDFQAWGDNFVKILTVGDDSKLADEKFRIKILGTSLGVP